MSDRRIFRGACAAAVFLGSFVTSFAGFNPASGLGRCVAGARE